jgi:hypothetical protein
VRVCVVTSTEAAAEPRAPRHAVAAKQALPDAEVIFVDLAPKGGQRPDPPILQGSGVVRRTIAYPTRQNGPAALAARKAWVSVSKALHAATGVVTTPLYGAAVIGLAAELNRMRADVYIAHNIETMLPAARAASANGARLIFDCMEYYSDMGDSQSADEARAARRLEAAWLGRCALVTASSGVLADVLAAEYGIPRPLPLYNTPPTSAAEPRPDAAGLRLYWRNAVVGFGQRGLDDILVAMTRLPADVTLSVQGRPPADGGRQLLQRIAELGLQDRVSVLPPYAAGEAVEQAARHDVGLCLEREGPANHAYTVSNKLFDYLMGGLAVVVADLPGLHSVVQRSSGGLLFRAGEPEDLAGQIGRLYDDRRLLRRLRSNARAFALEEGNLETEMARFRAALVAAVSPPPSAAISSGPH